MRGDPGARPGSTIRRGSAPDAVSIGLGHLARVASVSPRNLLLLLPGLGLGQRSGNKKERVPGGPLSKADRTYEDPLQTVCKDSAEYSDLPASCKAQGAGLANGSFTKPTLTWRAVRPAIVVGRQDFRMSASASLIPELEDVIQHGSQDKRARDASSASPICSSMARRTSTKTISACSTTCSCRLIAEIEAKARAEMSQHAGAGRAMRRSN